ncbi:MAG: NAD-dependent epimerase/dehydratase family protein [Methanoregula sp.]
MNDYYRDENILVAGGTGTIGIPLVKFLIDSGAKVTVASLDRPGYARFLFGDNITFLHKDLTDFQNCLEVTKDKDYVFNLVGIKGSTGIGESKVASYFVPMIWFQTNLMEASFRNNVTRFLFVSSICGYPQQSIPKKEDTMWEGRPLQNDRFPGLAKRIGEVQAETYLHEHGWDAVRIVRPSNVYGPFDDFNPNTAQVIPALIARICSGQDPLTVWGDGSAVRDFIFSEEVAAKILQVMEKAPPCEPINLGSGDGITIQSLVNTIIELTPKKPRIIWDILKPSGDPIRILSMNKAKRIMGFGQQIDIKTGLKKTIDWYLSDYQKVMDVKQNG